MTNPSPTHLRSSEAPSLTNVASPQPIFTRAANVLDRASASDPSTARALHEPHVALDAYGRILGISERFADKLGFRAAKLIGRRLRHRVLAADRARFQAMLTPLRSAQLPEPVAVRLRSKDERILETVLAPLAVTQAGGAVVIVLRVVLPPPPRAASAPAIDAADRS